MYISYSLEDTVDLRTHYLDRGPRKKGGIIDGPKWPNEKTTEAGSSSKMMMINSSKENELIVNLTL